VKASIIIPTHNRARLLERALSSLVRLDYPADDYEVIVVDNGSTDDTKETVARFSSHGIACVCEPAPGLHEARHRGAREAKGEVLVYVDDDVICDSRFLTELVAPYDDPQVGCVGGKILPEFEVAPPDWLDDAPKWYLSILDDEEGPKEVEYIFGCNFSIRRTLLFQVGGFNPDAFGNKKMWWCRGDGEIGLLKKVQAAGFKTVYTPAAVVRHFIPKQRLTKQYFEERAFKSGIEASFAEHRYGQESFGKGRFLRNVARFGIRYVAHGCLACAPDRQRFKHRIASSYYRGRCLYELRLMVDRELQGFSRTEAWLENE